MMILKKPTLFASKVIALKSGISFERSEARECANLQCTTYTCQLAAKCHERFFLNLAPLENPLEHFSITCCLGRLTYHLLWKSVSFDKVNPCKIASVVCF